MKDNIIEIVNKNGERRLANYNEISGLRFNFLGDNNHIVIHEGTKFSDCSVSLISNSYIELGASIYQIHKLYLFANDSRIEIGENFSCWGVEIRCHEPKCLVKIGNDCMFSEEILIYPTDCHTIYDIHTKEVLNLARPIIIGDHVWCGRRTNIMKGSVIPSNSTIDLGSHINSKFEKENTIISGIPAKVIKENVNWKRETPFHSVQS